MNTSGIIISVRLDCKLDFYLRAKALERRVQLTSIIRKALLLPVDPEVVVNSKVY